MQLLKSIRVSLKNPEQNALDDSTKLTSEFVYNTYAILNGDGECIEAKYKGIFCLPKVVQYDTNTVDLEITPDFIFFMKLKLKEYVNNIS